MDSCEATRVVFDRILKLEPEKNVSKIIIRYLSLRDHADQEMIRLAFGPDKLIHGLIHEVKLELGLISKPASSAPQQSSMNLAPKSDIPLQFTSYSAASPQSFPSPTAFRAPSPPYWDTQPGLEQPQVQNSDFIPYTGYPDSSIPDDYSLANQTQFLNFDDQYEPVNLGVKGFPNDYYYGDTASRGARAGRQSFGLTEFPVKNCLYFNRGFCKHGTNCRFYHGQSSSETFNPMFSPNPNDLIDDDHMFSPRSLEKLELEIIELLKSRRGNPVSIASLPLIYCEKYGKVLQAEGYLTESQRHGKAGYSLTKLLARLKNSIRLIDSGRPHGQHSVILAEDAHKYLENRTERSDPGPIVSGSRQIYLTFPAESTFTEEDVSNYFNTFGTVEDVRIPCQQKRMFGFVTFVRSDTVKMILAKGNPHFVCGARVLVKPYREKSKLIDRKYLEKIESPLYLSPTFLDMDPELHSLARRHEATRLLLTKRLMEEQEQALELERRRLSELTLLRKPVVPNEPSFGHSMNELEVSEDHSGFPYMERFNYFLDFMSNGSTIDDKIRNMSTHDTDQESQGLDHPESPFSSTVTSSISTVM